ELRDPVVPIESDFLRRLAAIGLPGTQELEDCSSPETLISPTEPLVPVATDPFSLGPYQLLEKLGGGGMGPVFKARHRQLDKIVALKVLADQLVLEPEAQARFQQEVRAISRLNHPNIVQAHDAAVEEAPYLAMEYVAGEDLARLLNHHGRLPP